MVQKNKEDQTSFCLVPSTGVEAQTGQLLSAIGGCQNVDSELANQSLLDQPNDVREQLTPNSEDPVVTKEQQNKWLVHKRRKRRICRKCVSVVLDKAIVNTNLEEEKSLLVEESCSKKAAHRMGRQQHCAASKGTLQKYSVSQVRQKRSSSSSCEKDIAPKKKCTCSFLEPELNISSSLETKKSKENHQKTLVKSELKNLIERDGSSAIVVECQEAVEEIKKCSVSEPEPLQKSWYLRKTIGSTQPEQETFRNEDKRQRTKLQARSLSLQSFKDGLRNGDCSYGLQPSSLDCEDCSGNVIEVRSFSEPHVSCNTVKGSKSLGKNRRFSLANLRLVKPQGEEQTLQQKCKSFSVELTQTKSCEDLQVLKQNHGCLLKSVAGIEDNKKCSSIAEKGRHGMVTRALLKSMIHENNSEKLDWKQENHVAVEIPRFRQGVLEKQMTVGQVVDSAPTESRVIPRVTGYSDKQMQGNDELVTSPELKIKIKTSREQKTEVSDILYEKLAETDQNISQGCSLPKLLEQSEYLQKTKLGETEYKDPVSCCLGREATLYCGDSEFPGTNCRGPQLLDVKITENQVGKDPLVVYQNDKLRCLTKLNEIPCRVIKNPVVKLLDCKYIKALLNPSSDQTIQSYKLHCEFPHVALDQEKDLCLNKGMGQNDLSCNSDTVQAGGSLSQAVLVAKGMCQKKMSPRFQNGNKRFRRLEFQKISKRMKITEDLEKSAIQGVISNRELYNEYKLQRDPNATTDSSIITEELKYDETVALPSLDVPDFIFKKHAQKHPDHLVTLPGNKQESQSHFTPYDTIDFETSAAIKGNDPLESKSLEPHTDFSSTVKDNSVVEILVDERITNYGSNIAGYMQGGKAAPKRKTVNKTGKKRQFSCQRIVPFLGKRIWPIESCARTSWFCKNHVSGSEFLRGTDSFANTSQEELHKPSIDTSKVPANKTMDCETELSVKSPLAESQLDTHKTASGTGNKNAISSTDMERCEQCLPRLAKKAKKCKITLNSSVKYSKKEENMVKTNVSTGTQNGIFVDSCKSKAKALVSKQETSVPQVPKTLSMGNLSNFKIPLLKNTSVLRKGRDHHSTLSTLEHSASSVNKNKSKVSSDSEHLFHSEQSSDITVAAVEEHTDKFDSSVAGSFPEESSVCNKDLATSLESDLELSALKDISNSLNIGYTKKPTESSVISLESYGDTWSNILTQNKDKLSTDVLKAYEDDALVIDVIQDDPDLFGNTDELEVTDSKEHVTDSYCSIISSEGKLMLKSESSPLLRSNLLKFSPRETQAHDTLKSTTDVSASLTKVDETISDSLSLPRGTTELSLKDEQLTELKALTRSSDLDIKYKISEVAAVKEKTDIQETKEIENAEHQRKSLDQKPELPFPSVTAVAPQWQGIVAKPWLNDFRFSWRGSLMPSTYPNCCGSLKVENNAAICFGLIVPHGYCRSHFGTLNGCNRLKCKFAHVPEAGSSKLCNEILKKYISIGEVVLLQRAVHIFTEYYRDITHGMQLDSQMLNDLLRSLLQYCLLKELFHILHTCILIKVLPDVDVLLKVFESVASMKLKEVVPELITISSKLADIGMVFEYEHFGCISKFFNQLQVSGKEIDIFMSRKEFSTDNTRFVPKISGKTFLHDQLSRLSFSNSRVSVLASSISSPDFWTSFTIITDYTAFVLRCKDKGDWTKLGVLFVHVRRGCEKSNLEKCSLFVANILINAVKEDRSGVAFCEFAAAVNAMPQHNEADKTLLGRIGISVLYAYYDIHEWLKARKILDTLHALRIHFSYLKGLIGRERFASRCEIVNVAVQVFLNSGSLNGAVWILKQSGWVINTVSWPCDKMDVLKRHNLLCRIASQYMIKNSYAEAFEVFQNLPGFQNSGDSLDVAQYSLLFNNLLRASTESKILGISAAVTDFMLAKNIPVDFQLLRAFITELGRSDLWPKARTYYRSALALGCYPPLEGNLYHKNLLIPSYVTEIEMLLAIEVFLVSNASSIQSPGASNQILQIILKRCKGKSVRTQDEYQSAVERLSQAIQLATPKLFLKPLTVNVNQEQVYSLEHVWVLKWLKENMKWAGKVWLFQ